MLHIAARNLKVHKLSFFLNIFICILCILLAQIYMLNINSVQGQLKSLAKNTRITGRITNLNGTQEVGLAIDDHIVQTLKESKFILNQVFTVQIAGKLGDYETMDKMETVDTFITGTNVIEGITGLDKEDVKLGKDKNLDVLKAEQSVCIAEENWMIRNGLETGDKITVSEFYYDYENEQNPMIRYFATEEYEIVGTMDGSNIATGGIIPNLVVPFTEIRTDVLDGNNPFFADSASFVLANPMEINLFKKEMSDLGLAEAISTANYSIQGNALVMNDSIFITAANKLWNSIDFLKSFLPVVLGLVLLVGYIVSFLVIQKRKDEIILMRLLGISRRECFGLIGAEYILIVALSLCLSWVIVSLLFENNVEWYYALLLGAFYCLGAAIAMLRCVCFNILKVESKLE